MEAQPKEYSGKNFWIAKKRDSHLQKNSAPAVFFHSMACNISESK